MAAFDEGILNASRPAKCGCQELLNKISLVHYGWLRRKCRRNALQIKFIKWPQNYVIIGDKCLYYFSSETSKSPDGAVSLYGFNRLRFLSKSACSLILKDANMSYGYFTQTSQLAKAMTENQFIKISMNFKERVVRASDIKSAEALWAFKLEHIQLHIKSIYFAASSEREMVIWMKAMKAEMLNANKIESRFKKQEHSVETESLSNSSWDSGDYKALEDSIYMEPVGSRISCFPETKVIEKQEKRRNEVSESEDEVDEKPPLPARSAHFIVSERIARVNTLPIQKVDDNQNLRSCGYSLQKKVSSKSKQSSLEECNMGQQALTDGTKINSDQKSYWESVYFHGGKSAASEVMNRVAENGVYLIRKSDDNSNVLLIYAQQAVKKFRIIEKENGQVSLTHDGPNFATIEDLLYYYYTSNLPNVNAVLVTPYKLSSSYQI